MRDKRTGMVFLVDSGSEVSTVPPRRAVDKIDKNYSLYAANGSVIKTYGLRKLTLELGLPKQQSWTFVIADVTVPILGADFLSHFHLLPNIKRKRLMDANSLCSAKCVSRDTNQVPVHSINQTQQNDRVLALLQKYSKITRPSQSFDGHCSSVMHYIEINGNPVYSKPRRLRPDLFQKVKLEFRKLADMGICRPSSSPWASPIVVVKKAGRISRIVGDYTRLNKITTPDRYPLPDLRDATDRLTGYTKLSKIDLVKAYYHINVNPNDIPKTAVTSPVGLYEFVKMPFGLRNAGASWQRFITSILGDLPFVFIYIDDILIYSSGSDDEHLSYIEMVFSRLSEHNLTVNLEKSVFLTDNLEFLGHEITPAGFRPTEQRIEFIKNITPPKTIAALRRVLGIFNFYRRFTPKMSEYLAPLNEILKGHPNKKDRTPVTWSSGLLQSFHDARDALINFTLLKYPRSDANMYLTTDASNDSVGAVLEQEYEGIREPLGFFSAKLRDDQKNWCPYDKELFAIYAAVQHFEYMITGRDFSIFTDHKPLIHMFTVKNHKLERRARQIEYIAQFSTSVKHICGSSNIIADTLSRPNEIEAISAPINEDMIAKEQQLDEECRSISERGFRNHKISQVTINDNVVLLCSEFQGRERPIVPKKLRYQVFRQSHCLSHDGTRASIRRLKNAYFWPTMTSDISNWCRACPECQKARMKRHTKSATGIFPPSDKFEHLHIDIVGPLKISHGYRYLCTFIDRGSRWTEAIPLQEIKAEIIARAAFDTWISRYGVPLELTSDRGSQFTSDVFEKLCKLLGANHMKTAAYNPKANGIVERWHSRLKTALKSHGSNWFDHLPVVLMGLRSAPRDETGISAAEYTFGKKMRLPGEFIKPGNSVTDARDYVDKLRESFRKIGPAPFTHKNKVTIFVNKDLFTAKQVYVRVDRVKEPLECPYEGPYEVLERKKKNFKLRLTQKDDWVSIDRLQPAYELGDIVDDTTGINPPENNVRAETLVSILKSPNEEEKSKKKVSIKVGKRVFYNTTYPNISNPEHPSPLQETPLHPDVSQPSAPSEQPKSIANQRTTRSGRPVKRPLRIRFKV